MDIASITFDNKRERTLLLLKALISDSIALQKLLEARVFSTASNNDKLYDLKNELHSFHQLLKASHTGLGKLSVDTLTTSNLVPKYVSFRASIEVVEKSYFELITLLSTYPSSVGVSQPITSMDQSEFIVKNTVNSTWLGANVQSCWRRHSQHFHFLSQYLESYASKSSQNR